VAASHPAPPRHPRAVAPSLAASFAGDRDAGAGS
jgi:hypothetical protein